MEPVIVTASVVKILESLFEAAALRAGKSLVARIKEIRDLKKRAEDYLTRTTNAVSYLTTYRAVPQHIDDVYVLPSILDNAVSQLHIPAIEFAGVLKLIQAAPGIAGSEFFEGLPKSADSRLESRIKLNYLTCKDLAVHHPRVVVLAEPGAGKSTLLSYLCRSRLRFTKPRLPVIVVARDLQGGTLCDALNKAAVSLHLTALDVNWMSSALSLYVDGLDEVEPARYKATCVEIARISKEMPSLEIVVACRAAAYNGELSFFKEVTLLPFDTGRAEDFIERWFRGVNPGMGQTLIGEIRKSEHLRQLSTQPLLLSLMCGAYRRYLNISRRQTTLFEQCVDSLLWQWDVDRGFSRSSGILGLDLEKRKWLHSQLAVRLHESKSRFADRRTVTLWLQELLPRFGIRSAQPGEVLTELCAHHGILVKWTEDAYGFGHMALQEYLTGKWYSSERRWEQLFAGKLMLDPWWENVIAFCIACLSDASEAMEALWSKSELSELQRLKLLTHSLKLDPIVSAELRDRVIGRTLTLYHNGKPSERDMALWMLVGIEDAWTAPVIRKSLAGSLPSRELAKLLERRPLGKD